MSRWKAAAYGAAFSLYSLPVLADSQPAGDAALPGAGCPQFGPMWRHGWGGGHGFFGPFLPILAVIGAIAIVLWIARWAGFAPASRAGQKPAAGSRAMEVLEERFARGEIDKAEFEDKRRTLGHSA